MKKTNSNHILTKEYLDKTLDERFGEFDEKLINLKKDLSNEMLNWKVEIVSEIKAMREEFNTHQYSHLRINETLEDHEKRLTSLGAPAM